MASNVNSDPKAFVQTLLNMEITKAAAALSEVVKDIKNVKGPALATLGKGLIESELYYKPEMIKPSF